MNSNIFIISKIIRILVLIIRMLISKEFICWFIFDGIDFLGIFKIILILRLRNIIRRDVSCNLFLKLFLMGLWKV